MNSPNTIQSNVSPRGGLHLRLQPAPAWTAILGLVIFTIIGILAGGNFLRIAFPVASFVVGLFLYKRYPILYMGFTWWLWFLTPLVRRLVDFRSGFQAEALILATPYLVTVITLPSLIRYLLKAYPYRQGGLPFILVLVAIFYSFLIGLVLLDFNFGLIRTFAEWICPVSFGFFIFSNWRNYPNYKETTQRTFFWGTLVMGTYGLIQFLAMPPWDSYWQQKVVEETGYVNAQANELGSAIWSTTNTNGTLALLLIPGILLLFNSKSPLRIPVTVVGCLVFLLTNSRTSWILSVLGLLILLSSLRSSLQIRIIPIILLVVLSVFPLSNMQPFSGMINSRLETLSNVQEDRSANARRWQYEEFLKTIPNNPTGYGMSSVNHPDSGIINLVLEMGWLGSVIFLSGLILLLWKLFQNSRVNYDVFLFVARATAISLAIAPSGNMFSAQPAFVIWYFASICMAGHIYHRHQLTNHNA
jgi:O-Antigen ligase